MKFSDVIKLRKEDARVILTLLNAARETGVIVLAEVDGTNHVYRLGAFYPDGPKWRKYIVLSDNFSDVVKRRFGADGRTQDQAQVIYLRLPPKEGD